MQLELRYEIMDDMINNTTTLYPPSKMAGIIVSRKFIKHNLEVN
jgi:hypothetical protein